MQCMHASFCQLQEAARSCLFGEVHVYCGGWRSCGRCRPTQTRAWQPVAKGTAPRA